MRRKIMQFKSGHVLQRKIACLESEGLTVETKRESKQQCCELIWQKKRMQQCHELMGTEDAAMPSTHLAKIKGAAMPSSENAAVSRADSAKK
eukprot:scaffold65637_cov16-Tisochrysis_lutea.AAC.3